MIAKRPRITREDSDDLGFVIDCLYSHAITMDEFNEWITRLTADHDDLPLFVFDLIDFTDEDRLKLSHWQTYGGFVPYWQATESETAALVGIGVRRFGEVESDFCTRDEALVSLSRHPTIVDRFHETFPFVDLQI